ncbi:MAG: HRDC domain-containing protein, partial [Myxococcales bacterium]|nr:HRDC domain-containing protein [Myxococcales bacterium]
PSAGPSDLTTEQRRLFESIRRWRNETAHEAGLPPYVVLTNRDIQALIDTRPDTIADLRRIPGIGKTKVDRYGEALLHILHPERSAAIPTAPATMASATMVPATMASAPTTESPPADDEPRGETQSEPKASEASDAPPTTDPAAATDPDEAPAP